MKELISRFILLFTVYPLFAQDIDQLSRTTLDSIWYTEDIIVTATRTEEEVFNIHGSGIYSSGRNVFLGLRITI